MIIIIIFTKISFMINRININRININSKYVIYVL